MVRLPLRRPEDDGHAGHSVDPLVRRIVVIGGAAVAVTGYILMIPI
jgi:hypothetical protein